MRPIRNTLTSAAAVAISLLGTTAPLHAQWRAAPTVAVGLAVPGGALHDAVAEGITGKVGVLMRAPGVPVGLTSELLYTHLRGGRASPRAGDLRIAAVLANVTTRRHDGRLDPYATLGVGWYSHGDPDDRFRTSTAPGVNVGIGEVIAVGERDYFVEVRLHAMHTTALTGRTWTTFMPLMMGLRF
jgi:hypothetical protein